MFSNSILFLTTTLFIARAAATNPFAQYANEFVDPDYIASRVGQFPSNLGGAQATVFAWADELNSHGPWSACACPVPRVLQLILCILGVTFKPVVAPSGDKHDYMSWAPYQWPDCSKVRNRTELTAAQIRKTCPYVNRDGEVNPERTIPNDFQSFFNLSDAILYNTLASTFSSDTADEYAGNAVEFIKTWFLDKDTAMNPNLEYAQMHLGPTGQEGACLSSILPSVHLHLRVAPSPASCTDLRMMVKVVSGVLILRKTKASAWTDDLDSAFVAWCKKYISWLESAPSAKEAASADNNHGTYAAGQMMALKIVVGDTDGATKVGRAFFGGAYNGMIAANGDQPLEATRTRPYHYRNFNIAGMITAARLLKYADPSSNVWNTSSMASGATIQAALDFTMGVDPSKDQPDGYDSLAQVTAEIYPNVAAVASTYGDPDGKYLKFLKESGFPYADDPFFVWEQPLAGGKGSAGTAATTSAKGVVSASKAAAASATASGPGGASGSGSSSSGAAALPPTATGSGSGANGPSNNAGANAGAQAQSAADTTPTGVPIGGLNGAGNAPRPRSAALLLAIGLGLGLGLPLLLNV
ncbi:Chondroitin AC/alginate lyase [Mycena kentingensis (nom. inval.)]|nr:Chondroitin AC/alginate lyase [Mycena kentingensis (nom. inval.)]